MKQIDECLDRFFKSQPPLQKKWKAFRDQQVGDTLLLFHYHHLVLTYHIPTHQVLYEWWERRADKRGLDAAKAYLEKRGQVV